MEIFTDFLRSFDIGDSEDFMQASPIDVESIFAKNRQKMPQPNLFTVLYLEHEKLGRIPITAEDIITVAEELVAHKLQEVRTALIPPSGSGTEADPYLLGTPQHWLEAIANFDKKAPPNSDCIYFKIGGMIIDIKIKDRYASDKTKDKEYIYEINIVATQLLKNALHEDGFEMLRSFLGKELADDFDITKLTPLILSLITQLNAKIKPIDDPTKKPTFEDPSYFTLAKLHANTLDASQLKDSVSKIRAGVNAPGQNGNTPEELDKALNAKLDNNSPEIQLLKNPDALKNLMTGMLQNLSNNKQFGGRDITPFINEFLPMVQTILPTQFDTTADLFSSIFNNVKPHLKHASNVPDWVAGDFKTLLQRILNQLGNITLDDKILDKLNEYVSFCALNETRLTLQNLASKANIYLPVTIASWFISEPVRYNPAFLGSLIMLDLIEARSKLPDYPTVSYDFYNALRNIELRAIFTDGYGVRYVDKCKCNNNCGKCQNASQYEEERDQFVKSVINLSDELTIQDFGTQILCKDKKDFPKGNRVKRISELANQIANKIYPGQATPEIGGYHPMTHHASYSENKTSNKDRLNISQQKLASLLLQWIQIQLQGSPFKVSLEKVYFAHFPQTSDALKNIKGDVIKMLVRPLLNLRLRHFDFMNNEHAHVAHILITASKVMGIPTPQKTEEKFDLSPSALLLNDPNSFMRKKPTENIPSALSLSRLQQPLSNPTSSDDTEKQICDQLQLITGKRWIINSYHKCYFSEALDEKEAAILVKFFNDKKIAGKFKVINKSVRIAIEFQQLNLARLQAIPYESYFTNNAKQVPSPKIASKCQK